jgi:16S rRNA (guanine527-N7)-methyltransferase
MIAVPEIESGIAALGLELREGDRDRLEHFLALLEKWNRVYNLTAIRDADRTLTHHLLDSLAILPHIEGPRVLDVGSGAGFPGIPLAILRPDLRVTLLDSHQKKAAFLRQAVVELNLANADVRAERVESWRADRGFDTVVSRAFAELGEFVAKARHLLAPGGVIAAMKGAYPTDELRDLPAGVRTREVVRLQVPGLRAERHLVLIEAIG